MQINFKLDRNFVESYSNVKPPFGFNGLGEFVFKRTYSRIKPDGQNEEWFETVERVVNGTYRLQKEHILKNGLPWSEAKAQRSAQEMFERIFTFKFVPPGRGLWAMGSTITDERRIFAALNNCAFVSTGDMADEPTKPFEFLMDMSMLGVGVGFDTKGAGSVSIHCPDNRRSPITHTIPDSREGWVQSLRLLLESYFHVGSAPVEFDYSGIRPEGLPIKGFGGLSSGPKPLQELHEGIRTLLNGYKGKTITSRVIVDIQNMIGKCVIAGNVRRTAEISLGSYEDKEYLDLKNYEVNPDRMDYGWTSNNSVLADLGMDYHEAAERTRINGEPGYVWLANCQKYGRLVDPGTFEDDRVMGVNPCSEQTLESYELCCLVETFPARHDSMEDYLKTLKFAYLYAKTVTLCPTHWPETNRVMMRNRRIGTSMTGIVQSIEKFGIQSFKEMCQSGHKAIQQYDKLYSEWFAVPRSVKTTSVKPSGSVSLLAGATPGLHFPQSRYYIRRVRVARNSPLLTPFEEAGYRIQDDSYDSSSKVIEFPVSLGDGIRTVDEVSMWEQLSLAAFMQKYWSDNAVSATITFDPETEGYQIEAALNYFQYQLKAISFLPKMEEGAYEQMPYESITKEQYDAMNKELKSLDTHVSGVQGGGDKYCDGDTCEIDFSPK